MDIRRSKVHYALRRLVNGYVLTGNVDRTQDAALRLQTPGASRDAEIQQPLLIVFSSFLSPLIQKYKD